MVYVGRLIALKRVDLLIRALTRIPEFKLRIIGDGPERGALMALAQSQGVSQRVHFLGYVPNTDLDFALEGCACALLPTASTETQAEQFGKAVLEAVLCGLPALVSDSGQLPLWTKQLNTVRRISDWTPEAVAEAVLELWKNPPSQESLLASRQTISDNYGAEAVGRRMETAFMDLLKERVA